MKVIHSFSSFNRSDCSRITHEILELMRGLGKEISYEDNMFIIDNIKHYISLPIENGSFWKCEIAKETC